MGTYSIIADVGQSLVTILRQSCVPDLLKSIDQIGLCTQQSVGDLTLGLLLYDVQAMDRGLFHALPNTIPLLLKYMMIANVHALPESQALEEHRLLGKVIQTFAEQSVLGQEQPYVTPQDPHISILFDNLSTEQKMRLLPTGQGVTKTVLCYTVSPVMIDVAASTTPIRVRSSG